MKIEIRGRESEDYGRTLAMALAAMLVALSVSVVGAQEYAIGWWTVDGGGGTSTGGDYTVSGTIGQPDAGMMSGGNYSLIGGFWGIVAATQTPTVPLLSVWLTQTNTVVVSWPAPAEGWLLHSTTAIIPGGSTWTEIPPPYHTVGATTLFYVESPPSGTKFYRLHKP